MRVGLRIGQPERPAPRQSQDRPAVDAELFAKKFDVGDQVGRRVRTEIGVREACIRLAPTASTLVEEHRTIDFRVEEPSLSGRAARPGASVQKESRFAARVPADLPVDLLSVTDIEHACDMRINGWKLS